MESAYYARHYIGQMFWFKTVSGYQAIDMINQVCDNGNDVYGLRHDLFFWDDKGDKITDFKMILKRGEDMSQEDRKKYKHLCKRIRGNDRKTVYIADTPLSLIWLLENGYDCFDLIDSGLAFDINRLPSNIHSIKNKWYNINQTKA